PHVAQQFFRPARRDSTRFTLDEGRNTDIFQRSEFRKKMMDLKDKTDRLVSKFGYGSFVETTDVFTIDQDSALICFVQSAQNREKSACSRSRFCHNCRDLYGIQFQVNAFQNSKGAITLIKVMCIKDAHGKGRFTVSKKKKIISQYVSPEM